MMGLFRISRSIFLGCSLLAALGLASGCIFKDVPDELGPISAGPGPDILERDGAGTLDARPGGDVAPADAQADVYGRYPAAGANSTRTCGGDGCRYFCRSTHADCDGDKDSGVLGNGCEVDLRTPQACGECTKVCYAQTNYRAVCVKDAESGSYECGQEYAPGASDAGTGDTDAELQPDAGP